MAALRWRQLAVATAGGGEGCWQANPAAALPQPCTPPSCTNRPTTQQTDQLTCLPPLLSSRSFMVLTRKDPEAAKALHDLMDTDIK